MLASRILGPLSFMDASAAPTIPPFFCFNFFSFLGVDGGQDILHKPLPRSHLLSIHSSIWKGGRGGGKPSAGRVRRGSYLVDGVWTGRDERRCLTPWVVGRGTRGFCE